MGRKRQRSLGLVGREPLGKPDVHNMSDAETNIQGEIREYYERVQRKHERMVAQAHLQEILNLNRGSLRSRRSQRGESRQGDKKPEHDLHGVTMDPSKECHLYLGKEMTPNEDPDLVLNQNCPPKSPGRDDRTHSITPIRDTTRQEYNGTRFLYRSYNVYVYPMCHYNCVPSPRFIFRHTHPYFEIHLA
jgi:hypothetical protein